MSTEEPTPTFKLKNGATEAKALVATTMMVVNRLLADGKAMVVFELVEMCRDRNHKPQGRTGDELKSLSLASESDG